MNTEIVIALIGLVSSVAVQFGGILINSKMIPQKTTRSAGGVTLMSLKKKQSVAGVFCGGEIEKFDVSKVRKYKIPATPGPVGTQLSLDI